MLETWEEHSMNHNVQIDDACAKGICAVGQNLGHQPRIYHICTKLKPKIIVETGVGPAGHGSTTYTFLVIAKEMDAQVYSLDIDAQNEWFTPKFKDQLDLTRWHFIQGNSVESLRTLPDSAKPIDFLHVDTAHTDQYVDAELTAAEPYLAERHVIASHDTDIESCRRGIVDWGMKRGYTMFEGSGWHGEVFITKHPELFEGLV